MADINAGDLTTRQKATIAEGRAADRMEDAQTIQPEDPRHRAAVSEAQVWATLALSYRTAQQTEELEDGLGTIAQGV